MKYNHYFHCFIFFYLLAKKLKELCLIYLLWFSIELLDEYAIFQGKYAIFYTFSAGVGAQYSTPFGCRG